MQANTATIQTMTANQTAPQRPWYREPWVWFIIAGPASVVVAGIYTGYLAMHGSDAVVVDDYYNRGQAINQDLRRDRAAAALGLSMKLRYDAAAGRLLGEVTARELPWNGMTHLYLAHATRPELDLNFLVPVSDGRFALPLTTLERARWQVVLEGEVRDWRLTGTWKWPHEAEVALDTRVAKAP